MDAFVLVAHRGESAHAPENTFNAFDAALDNGFAHFETDCQSTSDGVVVILHDEQLGRTTTGAQGAVASTTWADLSALDAGSWFGPAFSGARVPRLDQLLQRYHGRAHIHLELKSQQPDLVRLVAVQLQQLGWVPASASACQHPEPVPPVQQQPAHALKGVETLQPQQVPEGAELQHPGSRSGVQSPLETKAGDGQAQVAAAQPPCHPHFAVPGLTITSFHLAQLQRSVQALPSIVHGWLIHELTDDAIQAALAAGLRQLCPRANVLSAEAVQNAIAAGFSVRAWGIKDMQLLRHVVSCGCHGATVNWPREARDALRTPSSDETTAAGAPTHHLPVVA